MKNLIKVALIATTVFGLNANAAIFHSGDYKISADIVVNTSDSTRDDTYGIGRVLSIQDVNTFATYWTAGTDGQFINFNFSEYLVDPMLSSGSDFVTQTGLGRVNFWLNTSDLYSPVDSWTDVVANQALGSLLVSGSESGNTTGTDTGSGYRANGFLDVTGGSAENTLNTNGLLNYFNEATDMSFNISASAFNNNRYDYNGTADSLGTAVVPAPSVIWLTLTGIVSLVTSRKFI